MTWFKVDDAFAIHPKVLVAGNSAVGGWVRAGSWSAQQLTNGHVPARILPVLGIRTRDAQALVAAGLWVKVDDGYRFHAWEEYQPTKEAVEDKRAKDAERQRQWRESRRESQRDTDVTNDGVAAESQRPDPTRPDHKEERTSSSEIADAIPDKEPMRDDVDRICKHLQAKIVENGSKRPNITQSWRREARLLLDRDERTEAEIHSAIDWCQRDGFWKGVVLSMPKFREKFDAMRLKAIEQQERPNGQRLQPVPAYEPPPLIEPDWEDAS